MDRDQLHRNSSSNYVYKRNINCNDTMIENQHYQKIKRTYAKKRKDLNRRKTNDSTSEYFYDSDQSNRDSDIDEFYFEPVSENLPKHNKKIKEKVEEDSLSNYDEWFANP